MVSPPERVTVGASCSGWGPRLAADSTSHAGRRDDREPHAPLGMPPFEALRERRHARVVIARAIAILDERARHPRRQVEREHAIIGVERVAGEHRRVDAVAGGEATLLAVGCHGARRERRQRLERRVVGDLNARDILAALAQDERAHVHGLVDDEPASQRVVAVAHLEIVVEHYGLGVGILLGGRQLGGKTIEPRATGEHRAHE